MRIRILPEAERDLDIGCDFYDSQSPGAARFFLRGLLDDIDGLLKHAGVHEQYCGFFRAISKRFPFAIFYALSEDTIDIYAVLDCRQDPDAITSRLGERNIDRETRS
ncbi:MAG: type II toxin-antitoxin system RelE/ParE family toxin [Planctomycetia bacterium]